MKNIRYIAYCLIYICCIFCGQYSFVLSNTLESHIDKTNQKIRNTQIATNNNDNNSWTVSLDNLINLALQNNLDILYKSQTNDIKNYDYKISKGVYAPILSADISYQDESTPVIDFFGGSSNGLVNNKNQIFNTAIRGETPWLGTKYKLEFKNSRRDTTNAFLLVNPSYNSQLIVEFTQPLLKDLWIDNNRRNIKIKNINRNISNLQLQQQVQVVIFLVESNYYDLCSLTNQINASKSAVDLAEQFIDQTDKNIKLGLKPKIDLYSAQSQYQKQLIKLQNLQRDYKNKEITLKKLIANNINNDIWSKDLEVIINSHATEMFDNNDLEALMTDAIEYRPEFAVFNKRDSIEQLNYKYYINQGLPQINLVNRYSLIGRSGNDINNAVLDRFVGGYGTNIDNLFSGQYASVYLGLNISWPLAPHITQSKLRQSKLSQSQVNIQKLQFEQDIKGAILDSLNKLNAVKESLHYAQNNLSNQKKLAEAEQKKYNLGLTNYFNVLNSQNSLIQAENTLNQIYIDYHKAISQLYRTTGKNYRKYNFTI